MPACALSPGDGEDGGDDSATTSEATSAITSGGWGGVSQYFTDTWRGAQVTSLNGLTYYVTVGSCGSTDCYPFAHDTTQLRWWSEDAAGTYVAGGDVPNQSANSKVSLAAFNGYIYMMHTGSDDSSATYISRLDPTTHAWTQRKIDFTSYGGPPSIAAFNNKLYLIGISDYPYPMWYATMDTAENFTPRVNIPGHDSASRPSLTVAYNQLWFAHRWGSTGDIVYGTFNGTTWSPATHIYGGINNGPLQGLEPVIAYDQGTVTLVHQRINDAYLWTTTYNGCKWATTETSLGAQTSSLPPSLAQGGPGLVLASERDHDDLFGLTAYYRDRRMYTHPSPYRIPNCNVIGPVL